MRRRLLLSVGTVIGAIALLAISAASTFGAEPPVTFAAPIKTEPMPGSDGPLSGSMATADFNADGHDDVAVYSGNYQTGAHSLEVAISEVASDGKEAWGWHRLTLPALTAPVGGVVAAGQINRTDSLPDIVALSQSGVEGGSILSVYLNSGGGTFAAPIDTIDLPGFADGLAIGDVNGDGNPDVLIPTFKETSGGGGEAEVVTLLGEGDGHFEAPIVSPVDTAASTLDVEVSGIVIGDFTGSGHPDIAVSQAYNSQHDAYVMSGDGTGHFTVEHEFGLGGSFDLASGDFDGDGHDDFALAVGGRELSGGEVGEIAEERIATVLGDGAGSFTPLLPEEPNWEGDNPYSYTIRTADLNGDGRPDLVAPIASDSYQGGVWALLGNGDGTFSTVDREGLESDDVWAAEAGDFGGDGRSDDIAALVWPGGGSLELAIYENTSEPALGLDASSVDLGTAEVGQATTAPLAITNSGNYGLSVSSLAVGGADAADFSVSGCTDAPIAPGATCEATVHFAPTLAGSRSAALTVNSDDPTDPSATVALSGSGASAHPGGGELPDSSGGGGPTGSGQPGTSAGVNVGSSGSTSGTPAGAKPKDTKGEATAGAGGKLTIAKVAPVSKSGFARLKLTCARGCTGRLTLTAAQKKKKSGTAATKLGSTSYALGSRSETLTVKLSAVALAALAAAPSHKLTTTVAITPTAGPKSTAKVTLLAPRGAK